MRKLCGANNKFETSPQLEEEFATMKRHLKKTVVLSPLQVRKEMHIYTDTSSQGLGFILSQPHRDEEKENTDHYRMT